MISIISFLFIFFLWPAVSPETGRGRGYRFDVSPGAIASMEKALDNRDPYKRVDTIPESVDWRQKGAVGPVFNQGSATTCWSISAAGAVEGAKVAVGGASKLTQLSPQYLIDCMGVDCYHLGTPNNAFSWIYQHNQGSMYTHDSYPYEDADCIYGEPPHECREGSLDYEWQVTSYTHTIENNETDLMLAVSMQPVSVAIRSQTSSFTYYDGGIYYDPACEGITRDMLDHAVLLVGYGIENNVPYWIVKNSWGEDWGEGGYIRMKKDVKSDSGLCGIAIDASFPNGNFYNRHENLQKLKERMQNRQRH